MRWEPELEQVLGVEGVDYVVGGVTVVSATTFRWAIGHLQAATGNSTRLLGTDGKHVYDMRALEAVGPAVSQVAEAGEVGQRVIVGGRMFAVQSREPAHLELRVKGEPTVFDRGEAVVLVGAGGEATDGAGGASAQGMALVFHSPRREFAYAAVVLPDSAVTVYGVAES